MAQTQAHLKCGYGLPMPLQVDVALSGLAPGVRYKLYRYSEMENVPHGEFNEHASSAAQNLDFLADSDSMSHAERIMSNEVAVYRAVKASAP
jgi:hypothetical protein